MLSGTCQSDPKGVEGGTIVMDGVMYLEDGGPCYFLSLSVLGMWSVYILCSHTVQFGTCCRSSLIVLIYVVAPRVNLSSKHHSLEKK